MSEVKVARITIRRLAKSIIVLVHGWIIGAGIQKLLNLLADALLLS